jgi:hypothetical protein
MIDNVEGGVVFLYYGKDFQLDALAAAIHPRRVAEFEPDLIKEGLRKVSFEFVIGPL